MIQVLFKQFLLLWDLGQVNLCGNSWRTVAVSHCPPALPDISCAGFQTRCCSSSSSSCKCLGWGAECGACTPHSSVGTSAVTMLLLLLGSLHWRCGVWRVGVGSIHVSWRGLFFISVVAENLFCFSLFSETVLYVVVVLEHPWEEVSSASSYSAIFISNILTLHSRLSMTFFFLLSLLFQILYFQISTVLICFLFVKNMASCSFAMEEYFFLLLRIPVTYIQCFPLPSLFWFPLRFFC